LDRLLYERFFWSTVFSVDLRDKSSSFVVGYYPQFVAGLG